MFTLCLEILKIMEELQLIDGIKINKENPSTFEIPTLFEKSQIYVGQNIKIGVKIITKEKIKNLPEAERFWCIVNKINNDQTYNVSVNNDLVYSQFHGLSFESKLIIHQKNILTIF
jgi:hypothetical protein